MGKRIMTGDSQPVPRDVTDARTWHAIPRAVVDAR